MPYGCWIDSQQLRMHTALIGGPNPVPSTQVLQLTILVTPAPGDVIPSFDLCVIYVQVHIHTHTLPSPQLTYSLIILYL